MFETVIRKLVKVISADLFIPSSSIGLSDDLGPLALIERKASKWWFGDNTYFTANFTLQNVVSGGEMKAVVQEEKDLVSFTNSSTLKVNTSLTGHFQGMFNAELDDVDSITLNANLGDLHIVEVNTQSLLDQLKGRKLDMQHELISELSKKKRTALCVVVSVVKTMAPATITATLNVKVTGDEKVDVVACGEEAKIDVENDITRTLDLPAGTVLAYQVLELAVNDEGTFRVMVSHDSSGGFHSTIDRVDSCSDTDLRRKSLSISFEDLSLIDPTTRELLGTKLLKLSPDPDLVQDLFKSLKSHEANSENSLVQAVLDCMSEHRDDAATVSLQFLCKALRRLDDEQLSILSSMQPEDIPVLSAIVELTFTGSSLPLSHEKMHKFITEHGHPLAFLTVGLNYTLDKQTITPPSNSHHLLFSANAALLGLMSLLGSADTFLYE